VHLCVDLIETLVERFPAHALVVMADEDPSSLVLPVMRAGADDFVVRGRDEAGLMRALERTIERKRLAAPSTVQAPAPVTRRDGVQVLSLFAAPQSPQLAYIAGHSGLALKDHCAPGQRVLVIDITQPGASLPILFGVQPALSVLDVLADVSRYDETLVESAFFELRDDVFILGLPEINATTNLAERLESLPLLLTACRQLFEYIVIVGDGGMGAGAMSQMIDASDQAWLVTDPAVLSVRHNRALLDELYVSGTDRSRIQLLVRSFRGYAGIEAQRLATLLNVSLAGTVGGRWATLFSAMDAGESMFDSAPSDLFGVDIRRLVEALVGKPATSHREGGLLRRLMGRGASR